MKKLITIAAILFSIILVVLAVSCFVVSTVVTTTSLRQPNAQIFDIPIELSKPNVYRTDFHPARYSLGIEFNLKFDELYSANKKMKDLEIQIAVIDKTAGVLFEEIKTSALS